MATTMMTTTTPATVGSDAILYKGEVDCQWQALLGGSTPSSTTYCSEWFGSNHFIVVTVQECELE